MKDETVRLLQSKTLMAANLQGWFLSGVFLELF